MNLRKNIHVIFFIIFFTILYFLFLIYVYIIPQELNLSFYLFIGFTLIIISIFLFANYDHEKEKFTILNFKFISDNSIKLLLLFLMCLTIITVDPISRPSTVILWNKIKPLNYVRAIIFVIGSTFIPGSSIYNILFPKKNLHERFKIEPYIIKITIFPLLSFTFIGLSILILDQLGLNNKFLFSIILFSLIIFVMALDLIIQKIRFLKISFKFEKNSISRYTLIILILSLAFVFISIGIHFGTFYLEAGDSWAGLSPVNSIGKPEENAIEYGRSNYYYPIFWSYIIYGLSILCGLPYINTNAFLGPFCYLYVTTIYLLMKAILLNFKEKYVILSTIFASLFSGLFYMAIDPVIINVQGIIIFENFIFKSYAYLTLFLGLALFTIILKKISSNNKVQEKNVFKFKEIFEREDFKLISLSSLFLVISFMTYSIPLLYGLIFVFIYSLFSYEKLRSLHFLSVELLFITFFFIILDILMNFYLSAAMVLNFYWFFQIKFFYNLLQIIPSFVFIYFFLFGLFVISYIIRIIVSKYYQKKNHFSFRIKKNPNMIFKYTLIIFTILFIIEVVSIILEKLVLNFYLENKYAFFYILDSIILNIGLTGILAIYLSYFCFVKEKNLFYFLICWILICLIISFSLFFVYYFQNFSFLLHFKKYDLFIINFWFNRNWSFSFIGFSIITSIGIFKFIKVLKKHPKFKTFFNNETKKKFLKFSCVSILIFLCFSNIFLFAAYRGDANNKPNKEEIEIIGWMSDHIPDDSRILMENNYIIRLGIFSMVHGNPYYLDDVFDPDYSWFEFINETHFVKDEKLHYLLISKKLLKDDADQSEFIKNYLIPNFYNESEYENNKFLLYYAPYFD